MNLYFGVPLNVSACCKADLDRLLDIKRDTHKVFVKRKKIGAVTLKVSTTDAIIICERHLTKSCIVSYYYE